MCRRPDEFTQLGSELIRKQYTLALVVMHAASGKRTATRRPHAVKRQTRPSDATILPPPALRFARSNGTGVILSLYRLL